MKDNETFQMNYQKMKHTILNDPVIKSLLSSNPQLTRSDIDKNLMKLYEYTTQSKQCAECKSLQSCKNILPGYTPKLTVENNEVHLAYTKCQNKMAYESTRNSEDLIKSLYMPREILEASLEKIYSDPVRSKAIRESIKFIEEAKFNVPAKGIYFYGPFGVGKTYFLGAIANALKKYHISSMIIYMPEFVREIRDSIKDDSINDKINYFKNADVLMFDDIGAETQSAWFRDEVLGSILQYRMMERLPVFFTSNYSLDQLEVQLSETTRGGIEEVKAGRIMERIRQVSKEIPLFGDNYRNVDSKNT